MATHIRTAALALGLGVLGVQTASAAVVTVTDCTQPPVTTQVDSTRIEIGSDDLVLHCALVPLPGTDHIRIEAHDVLIEAPGSVSAGGNFKTEIDATGSITLRQTNVESTNNNATLNLYAVGDIVIEQSTVTNGNPSSGGDALRIECTGTAPKCTLTVTDSTLKSRKMYIRTVGDQNYVQAKIITNSPTDLVRMESTMGSILLGGASQGPGGDCCGFGGGGGTSIVSGNEGNLIMAAFGRIDLSGANILIAENICGAAGLTSAQVPDYDTCGTPCAGGSASAVPADIDVTDASVRNDFAKKGNIKFCADETREDVTIQGAILIDDDTSATNDLSTLNGCDTLPRSGCPNVVGTANTDS